MQIVLKICGFAAMKQRLIAHGLLELAVEVMFGDVEECKLLYIS